jgi:regulator of RNase E activity RraA
VSEAIDRGLLEELRSFDTPTLCNALEVALPSRQGHGFTRPPLHCVHPDLPAMVGFARTARICASRPSDRDPASQREVTMAYYRHVAKPPQPTITVIEDIDREPVGAWWGEVHTHMHRGLGSLGVVTNGTVRDLDQVADGFQVLAGGVGPSHAHVHVVDVGVTVTVAGMTVSPGDLVHADRHGALVIPADVAPRLPEAARRVMKVERVLIEASKQPDFGIAKLEELLSGSPH